MSAPTVELPSGQKMPVVGLGTSQSRPTEVAEAVKAAIDAGYRHIDCAFKYGNEPEIGAGLKVKFEEGVVKREDMFITSKLWNTFHHPDDVRGAVERSLRSLGLDYLDLYLIHWPMAFKRGDAVFPEDAEGKMMWDDTPFTDTWKALEACVEAGLLKNIGLSNFNSKQIQAVIDVAKVKPAVIQVECHPYLNQKQLLQFSQEKGLVFTAYSPLCHPNRPSTKPRDPSIMEDPKLKPIADKYGKSVAQVVLRWGVQRGAVVIPKSVTPARIQQNIRLFDFALTSEEMATLDGLDVPFRIVHLDWVHHVPEWPFHEPF
ncbi:PREDICTED: alcohol dehydrogenase [NADP(+)]-like [Branchiostoma belcheri]|uniref:alcohol dehydrogenase (NADP(+)) n=1 Tax=Branchiostoma belcheri TaxID=7741 RepID=A0A6P4Z2I4_BRABE|nr:PREDICTED: alcohol dehydrogenase [NADP(+)]-like [Branchiostoma belcheri]